MISFHSASRVFSICNMCSIHHPGPLTHLTSRLCSPQLPNCASLTSCFAYHFTLQAEAAQAGMKELQAQAASYQKDAGKLRGGMAAAATAVEAVRSSRHGLMEAAVLEQVGRGLDGHGFCVLHIACYVACHKLLWQAALQARPHGGAVLEQVGPRGCAAGAVIYWLLIITYTYKGRQPCWRAALRLRCPLEVAVLQACVQPPCIAGA